MTHYKLVKIEDSIKETITFIVQDICKENKINYEKQDYRVLFSNEKILVKNNDVKFTSGSKNSLSFYGKIYSNKRGRVIESIYLKDDAINLEPNNNSLLIVCEGIKNSTTVDDDQDLLHFYVAPANLTIMQDPSLWQAI
jgi:hypothetical protein